MALLRCAPETVVARMFPGLDAELRMIGLDADGNVVCDLHGADVPDVPKIVAELRTEINSHGIALIERVTVKAA